MEPVLVGVAMISLASVRFGSNPFAHASESRRPGVFAAVLFIIFATCAAGQNASSSQHAQLPVVAPAVECATLTTADLSQKIGASAKVISAETAKNGNAPAYCRVKVSIEDFIAFEVHLPTAEWSQRLLFSEKVLSQSQRSSIGLRLGLATCRISWLVSTPMTDIR